MAECLRQIVPDSASIRKSVFVFTRGVTKVRVSDADRKWPEILFLGCTVCLEQCPLRSYVTNHTHIF